MPDFFYETQHDDCVVGVDEVGMGCWAGPVVAAAAFVPQDISQDIVQHIDDSKKLSAIKRIYLYQKIMATPDIKIGLGLGSVEEIEQKNIRQASFMAMKRAIENMGITADFALIDGNGTPTLPCPYQTIIRGDQKSYSIAVASVIAKVERDQYMAILHKDYPQYGWEKNAGYGTQKHQEALEIHGVSPHHRATYAPIVRRAEKK